RPDRVGDGVGDDAHAVIDQVGGDPVAVDAARFLDHVAGDQRTFHADQHDPGSADAGDAVAAHHDVCALVQPHPGAEGDVMDIVVGDGQVAGEVDRDRPGALRHPEVPKLVA